MKRAWILTLLLCVSTVPLVTAQEQNPSVDESGNAFLAICEDVTERSTTADRFDMGECAGHVAGFDDGMQTAFIFLDKPMPYCLPDGVTKRQMIRVLIKFIKDHPEKAQRRTSVLELDSFIDAFPCKQPSKKR